MYLRTVACLVAVVLSGSGHGASEELRWPVAAVRPSWDGIRLAVLQRNVLGKPWSLHIVNLTTDTTFTVPVPQMGGEGHSIEWHPSGSWIVATVYQEDDTAAFWQLDLDAQEWRPLIAIDAEIVQAPRFTRDGRLLAFRAAMRQDVAVLDLASVRHRFATDIGDVFRVSHDWTPDGNRLVYGRRGPADRGSIWLLDLEASASELVTDGMVAHRMRVSPDGQWLLWTGHNPQPLDAEDQLFLSRLDPFRPTVLAARAGGNFEWSPCGDMIVFESLEPRDDRSEGPPLQTVVRMVTRSEGSFRAADAKTVARGTGPQWARGGKSLVWIADAADTGTTVVEYDLATGRTRVVFSLAKAATAERPKVTAPRARKTGTSLKERVK